MWYTHYLYYDTANVDDQRFDEFTSMMLTLISHVKYKQWIDIDYTDNESWFYFNWSKNQKVNKRVAWDDSRSLQWPSDDVVLTKDKISSTVWEWYAWLLVDFPVCPRTNHNTDTNTVDASYETMCYERVPSHTPSWYSSTVCFSCCKTNYYPYDPVVTASLMLFKAIFPDAVIRISSDWEIKDRVLGYLLLKDAFPTLEIDQPNLDE